jgi:hypothetical protein
MVSTVISLTLTVRSTVPADAIKAFMC